MPAAELKFEPTLCHGLVEAVAASLRAHADGWGVKLVVARSSEDIVSRTDRKLLGRIVMDLVGRAIEGAPGGVVHVSVLRVVADGRKMVEISVAEIAKDPGATRPESAASALDRCQEQAALLGGKLTVRRKSGEGSTYVMLFPEL